MSNPMQSSIPVNPVRGHFDQPAYNSQFQRGRQQERRPRGFDVDRQHQRSSDYQVGIHRMLPKTPNVHHHSNNNYTDSSRNFPSFPHSQPVSRYDHFGNRQFPMNGQFESQRFEQSHADRSSFNNYSMKFRPYNKDQLSAGMHLEPVLWENEHLEEANYCGYTEHPDVAKLSDEDVKQMYRDMEITVQAHGKPVPNPIQSFDHAPFPDWMIGELYRLYSSPTPIQCCGWPSALSSRDMIGIAQTGSGKTLAYLLPGIIHIEKQPPLRSFDGPLVLVLAPTRELAMQIEKEAFRFAAVDPNRLRVVCVYGGVQRGPQAMALQNGVHICIATPGRLLDFLETKTTNLKRVTYLVLDEADRMLDMGFEPQIRKIVSQIRPDRQTLMWSATWPKEIQNLARDFCRYDPVRVTVGSHDLQANTCIRQIVEVCPDNARFPRLLQHLSSIPGEVTSGPSNKKILIFCETKRGCDILRDSLQRNRLPGVKIASIHGDKEQRERDRILGDFKSGRVNTLIATDVASRGLDIKNIDLVINFDVPKTIEDYIHRIGRTGRAGAQGTAITLFNDGINDAEKFRMAKEISSVIADVGQTPPDDLLGLARMASPGNQSRGFYGGNRGGRGGRFNGGGFKNFGNGRGGRSPRGRGGFRQSPQAEGPNNNSHHPKYNSEQPRFDGGLKYR
ncbi:uncharacterized protein LOC129617408, partial [Condylostylus longicornis]|uniref:uncharacterized protein LOC129617408 n=1 Tax=Condylostylus longicornis TaxID=2530218 RepID=UPI00244E2589